MIEHELQIAPVGFEIDVEDIAQDRDASRHRVEGHIDQHLEERSFGTPTSADPLGSSVCLKSRLFL